MTDTLIKNKTIEPIRVLPLDRYNQNLVDNVHPRDWKNPEPKDKYDLVVIGAGTAGLISAIGSATLGAKVALIEKHLMGGDCLNVGCVPSKGLIRAARAAAQIQNADQFGIEVPAGVKINFPKIMERMRRLRAQISRNDSAKRYSEFGIDVFLGQARFSNKIEIEVGGKKLKFSKAVLATGARAAEIPIDGLKEAGYLTNETLFTLTELPKRFGVIGSGPIGCEMAQAFQRFGSDVFLFEKTDHILPREDRDARQLIEKQFLKEGMHLLKEAKIKSVIKSGNKKIVSYELKGEQKETVVDELLIGIGRAPNVEGLELEKAGVEYDKRKGIRVNDKLETTNPLIYAAGDICFPYKFTHTAEAMAGIVIQNALYSLLFAGKKKTSSLVIPWCTYTDPEVAHVGLYKHDADKKGIETDTFIHHLNEVDRAILDGEDEGFVKILSKKGTGKILGATIVAAHAGEMISEITLAMNGKINLGTVADVIHPYPTQAEGIKRAGGKYKKTKLTPKAQKFLNFLLKINT